MTLLLIVAPVALGAFILVRKKLARDAVLRAHAAFRKEFGEDWA